MNDVFIITLIQENHMFISFHETKSKLEYENALTTVIESYFTQRCFQHLSLAISMLQRTPQNSGNKEFSQGSGSTNAKVKRPEFNLKIPPQPSDPRL